MDTEQKQTGLLDARGEPCRATRRVGWAWSGATDSVGMAAGHWRSHQDPQDAALTRSRRKRRAQPPGHSEQHPHLCHMTTVTYTLADSRGLGDH